MSDRLNTIFGWILFSGIVALGLSTISNHYYSANKHEAPEVAGYPIEGGEEEGGADAGPSLAQLLAEGSADAGEAVFAKCVSCHTVEQGGANGIGPNLYGIVGQPIGSHVAGFAYSSALADHGGEWSYENLDAWFASPRGFANGTKMSFAGLSSPADRANVILYLREYGGGPALPEYVAAEAPAEGEEALTGNVEGGEVEPVEAVDAMGDATPVPEDAAAAAQ